MDLYDGRDPRDVPTYMLGEVARFLRMPSSTLRSWVVGRTEDGVLRSQPVIKKARVRPVLLSFWDLIEAHVLATIRRGHELPLQNVRKALAFVEDKLNTPRPLLNQEFLTNGADLFVDLINYDLSKHAPAVLNVSQGGRLDTKAVAASLTRIERDVAGLAERLFPWSNVSGEPRIGEPRIVSMDPRVSFGRPVIHGTGGPVEILDERIKGGDTPADLAQDYGLELGEVEGALRWFAGDPAT